MPEILIDVMRLFFRRDEGMIPTGIDRVSLEYIRHYGGSARAVLSLGPLAGALSRRDSQRVFEWLLHPRPGFRPTPVRLALKNTPSGWIRPGTGNSILFNTAQLWKNTRHYAAQLRWLGARPVFFVHDLIPLSHPEYFRPAHGEGFEKHMRNMLGMACGIVANSRFTGAGLRAHAAAIGLRCPPTVVAPLAPALSEGPALADAAASEPYFVALGTIEPRKNYLLLLHIWRDLIAKQGRGVPRLYVVGQRGWECENVVDLLERCAPLKGLVVERNDCGDAELSGLLRHARALLLPTFAEGFGLPVAEALAAGVPVIASDLPVFREFAGDVPEYADPIDGRRWRELILEYAKPDSALCAAQLERLKGFRPATWEEHFRIVDRFLESLP